jgi:lysophospholipase L1-like esterase
MVPQLLKRGALAGVAVLGAQAAYAVLRPVPEQKEFDPSGVFGDPKAPPLRVVVLGDSSVTAPGVGDVEQIWVRVLARRIAERRKVTLESVAIGGATTGSIIRDQLDRAVGLDADLALVSVGANDAIRSLPLKRFESELERIVTLLQESGAAVVISGVADLGTIPRLYPPLRGVITRRSLSYDQAHQRVAERTGATWLNPRRDDRSLWLRDRSLWSADLFHVSSHGHARWAESTWDVVAPILDEM